MATISLEERMAAMEAEIAELKAIIGTSGAANSAPWWEQISGAFKDDPIFDEAMRLGRDWRKAAGNEFGDQVEVTSPGVHRASA